MKKASFLFIAVAAVFFSCQHPISYKEKLMNKWVVINAKIFSPSLRGLKEGGNDSVSIMIRAMENAYKGQVYDLRSDDKFTTIGKLKTASGTWYEKDGEVQFLSDEFKQATWKFNDNKIEIGHDSSLVANLDLGLDSSYVQLTLKPAPGQAVKTDY